MKWKSRKFLWWPQFFQKPKGKGLFCNLGHKIEVFRWIFGKIRLKKKCFRDFLTFSLRVLDHCRLHTFWLLSFSEKWRLVDQIIAYTLAKLLYYKVLLIKHNEVFGWDSCLTIDYAPELLSCLPDNDDNVTGIFSFVGIRKSWVSKFSRDSEDSLRYILLVWLSNCFMFSVQKS